MRNRSRGFTMIELVVALIIGVILTSIAVRGFSGLQGKMAARQGRQVFATLHARTRAQAIEFGQTTNLNVNFDADSVWISRGTAILEVMPFMKNLGVDVTGGTGTLRLCMNARGFADTSCNSFSSPQTITFQAGADTASVTLQTLGQLQY
jgi:prepilin-type N-terminal cleavage/methylation domain-containing protein